MTRVLLSTLLILLSLQSGSSFVSDRPVGCPEPPVLAAGLGKLQQTNWRTISVARIMAIWRTPLNELACEGSKPCRILVSEDRVIKGQCECCVAFVFDVEHNKDGSGTETLNNVIVHYSVHNREQAKEVAKTLARAIGVNDAQVAELGRNLIERYEWMDERDQIRQSYLLEVRFTPPGKGSDWELYLSLGATPI